MYHGKSCCVVSSVSGNFYISLIRIVSEVGLKKCILACFRVTLLERRVSSDEIRQRLQLLQINKQTNKQVNSEPKTNPDLSIEQLITDFTFPMEMFYFEGRYCAQSSA